MNSKECLKHICDECQINAGKIQVACPFRSISNEYCDKYETIKQDLDRLEQLEKENQKLKLINKQLLEDNDFMNNQNRMLEDVVKLFKRNLYASILDNNMPKNKTNELLQLLDKVLGGIGIIYE